MLKHVLRYWRLVTNYLQSIRYAFHPERSNHLKKKYLVIIDVYNLVLLFRFRKIDLFSSAVINSICYKQFTACVQNYNVVN